MFAYFHKNNNKQTQLFTLFQYFYEKLTTLLIRNEQNNLYAIHLPFDVGELSKKWKRIF